MTLPTLSFAQTRPAMLALALTLGLFLISCARRPNHQAVVRTDSAVSFPSQPQRININVASAKELAELPGIGEGFAARIVEHREKYGPFRRTEHLIIVRGISDRRFRALRDLITVE